MKSIKMNKYLSVERIVVILFLIFSCVLLIGCSQSGAAENTGPSGREDLSENNMKAIHAVIEKEFTGPDHQYSEIWEAAMEAQPIDMAQEEYDDFLESPVYKKLTAYTQETYAPYFTENGYDAFVNTTPAFMYTGLFDYTEMKPVNIEIQQNDKEPTLYSFTFQADYEDGQGKKSLYNFEGSAIVPKEGKIGKIQFQDKDGLLQQMNGDSFD